MNSRREARDRWSSGSRRGGVGGGGGGGGRRRSRSPRSRSRGGDSSASERSAMAACGLPTGFGSNFSANLRLSKPCWNSLRLEPVRRDFYREDAEVAARSPEQAKAFLDENQASVSGCDTLKLCLDFDQTGFPPSFLKTMQDLKYNKPTCIQALSWPVALSGRDLIGIAKTGSGKTLAYSLPGMVHLKHQSPLQRGDGPIVLVLTPTRELATQISDVVVRFTDVTGIRVSCVYGGASKGPQLRAIENGAEFCIATPGRILDFLEARKLNLLRCSYLVLDEADRMLDMGFEPQIRKVLDQIRPDRQTLMFSATWPTSVRKLAEEFLRDPCYVTVGSIENTANHNILQIVDVCKPYEKIPKLFELMKEISQEKNNKTIIFTETKRGADDLAFQMRKRGYKVEAIHGDKRQEERERVLGDFRSSVVSVLIATDVASRGIDVEDVNFVVNYDYPNNVEDYVHRIGRTARAERTGTAYTFFTANNVVKAKDLIEVLKEANQVVNPKLHEIANCPQSYGSSKVGSRQTGNGGERRRGGSPRHRGASGGRGAGFDARRGFGGGSNGTGQLGFRSDAANGAAGHRGFRGSSGGGRGASLGSSSSCSSVQPGFRGGGDFRSSTSTASFVKPLINQPSTSPLLNSTSWPTDPRWGGYAGDGWGRPGLGLTQGGNSYGSSGQSR